MILLTTEDNILPGCPKGTGSAEISLHPSGKWLYVSTRLTDMMTVFDVNSDAAPGEKPLRREQLLPCPVTFPRSFAMDPSGKWIIVAGQADNQISVLKIDAASGRLSPTSRYARMGSPVGVLFRPSF